jgi:hypothetical protein
MLADLNQVIMHERVVLHNAELTQSTAKPAKVSEDSLLDMLQLATATQAKKGHGCKSRQL